METKINAINSFDALAELCQQWAEEQGIELDGTYTWLGCKHPKHARVFHAFAARCSDLARTRLQKIGLL